MQAILTASCGLESSSRVIPYKPLLDGALRLAKHSVSTVIMVQRPQARAELTNELDWESEMAAVRRSGTPADPAWLDSNHPGYILYTSGTTGTPKVRAVCGRGESAQMNARCPTRRRFHL